MAKKFMPESRYTRTSKLDPLAPALGEIVHVHARDYVPSVGLLVSGFNFDGLIPNEEITIYPEDPEKIAKLLLKKKGLITAKVSGVSGMLILSRKASMKDALGEIHPGDILHGKITNFHASTTFMDIGAGISAILPIREVSTVHLEPYELANRFSGLDTIRVKVLGESPNHPGKFVCSYKQAFKPLPLSEGDITGGRVASMLEDGSGMIVEISPIQAGIVDISLPWVRLLEGRFYKFRVKRVRPKEDGSIFYSLDLIEE